MSKRAAKKAIVKPKSNKQTGHSGRGAQATAPDKDIGSDNKGVQATAEVRAAPSKGDKGAKQKKEARTSESQENGTRKRTSKRVIKPQATQEVEGQQAKGQQGKRQRTKDQQDKREQAKGQQAKEGDVNPKASRPKVRTQAEKKTRNQPAETSASVPAARRKVKAGPERKRSKKATDRTQTDETVEAVQSAGASAGTKRGKRNKSSLKSSNRVAVKQTPAELATGERLTSDQDEAPVSFVNSPFALDVGSTPDVELASEAPAPGHKRNSGSKRRGKARSERQPSPPSPPRAEPQSHAATESTDDSRATDSNDATEQHETQPTLLEGDAEDVATIEDDDETSDEEVEGEEGHQEQPVPELSEEEEAKQYLKGLIEALLFSSDKPMTARELARAARLDKKRTQELLRQLRVEYRYRGINLTEVSGGFVLRSNPTYGAFVQKALALRPVRLSRAQLETLAIVAYRQPITRPEIDDIRGVDSGQVLKGLADRDLIKILGKKDEVGRPMLYGTTPAFLELFSLDSLKDLPSLREFTELSDDSREKFAAATGETVSEPTLADIAGFSEQETEAVGNEEPQEEGNDQPEGAIVNPATVDGVIEEAVSSSGHDAVGDEGADAHTFDSVGEHAQAADDEQAVADDEDSTVTGEQAAADDDSRVSEEQAVADYEDSPFADEEAGAGDEQAEGDVDSALADEETAADDQDSTVGAEQAAEEDEDSTVSEEQAAADEDSTVSEEQAAEENEDSTVGEEQVAEEDEDSPFADEEAGEDNEKAEDERALGFRGNGSEDPGA